MNPKSVFLASILILAAHSGRADGPGVQTHAYVYTDTADTTGRYATLVLDQGWAFSIRSCTLAQGENLPVSPAGLLAFAENRECGDALVPQQGANNKSSGQLFYEPAADRVLIGFQSYTWGYTNGVATISNWSTQGTFDWKNPGQIAYVYTQIESPDGSNPTITTKNTTSLLRYDAMISYAKLPEYLIKP
jgi:hypothetical protein